MTTDLMTAKISSYSHRRSEFVHATELQPDARSDACVADSLLTRSVTARHLHDRRRRPEGAGDYLHPITAILHEASLSRGSLGVAEPVGCLDSMERAECMWFG